MLVLIFIVLIIALCIGLVLYGRQNYGVLEGSGFPVVPPTLFTGSNPNLHKEVQHEVDIAHFKKYGGIWGLYEGRTPQVYVCDPELVRLIFAKDHDHFYDRRDPDLGSAVMNEMLDFLPGEKWKTVRAALTLLFTTSKLKAVMNVIEGHAREYAEELKTEAGAEGRIRYDCKKRFSTWFVDTYARSTLGVELQNSKDPENEFVKAFRAVIGEDIVYNWLYTLSMTFPFLSLLSPTFDDKPAKVIETTLKSIFASRRSSGRTDCKDYVDVLNDLWARVDTPEFKALGITHNTVISQVLAIFIGGSFSSSSMCTHLFYYVAADKEIQDRLFSEIISQFPTAASLIDHDTIKEEHTPYLTACINEALRIAPSSLRPERICTKDWAYEGISIKRGTMVLLPSWAAHRDPVSYPEPNRFKPERFLPENRAVIHPYAFTAFGFGHRNCIGSRFAYDSLKIFLIHMLRAFRVELRSDSRLEYKKGVSLMSCLEPVYIELVRR